MSDSKITMIGMYDIMKYDGVDLFELLSLPDGIDKDTVVADILQTSSEFEVMYSSPQFIHDSIRYWSKKWFWTFDKWIKAISIEYQPLHNYDRHEEWTDDNVHVDDDMISSKRTTSETNDGNSSGNNSEGVTASGSTISNGTVQTDTNAEQTDEHTVSAFDSSSYSPKDKDVMNRSEHVSTATHDETATDNQSNLTGSEAETHHDLTTGSDDYDETRGNKGSFNNIHKGYMYGNIGVTSSQDMLQQELDIAMFNLYDRITDIFIQEYCIPVYI